MSRAAKRRPSLLTSLVASVAIALVLALTVLSSSPDLHDSVHGHAKGASQHHAGPPSQGALADEDGCAVTLFSQGLVLALVLLAAQGAPRALRATGYPILEQLAREKARYLHLPTQAPPLRAA